MLLSGLAEEEGAWVVQTTWIPPELVHCFRRLPETFLKGLRPSRTLPNTHLDDIR